MSATLTPAAEPSTASESPPEAADSEACVLTSHVPLRRVMMLVNPLSGSVGQGAAQEAQAILERYACETSVETLEAGRFDAQIEAALDARPDVLFVRQTQRGHQEVSLELFHLRARLSARRSADGKPLPPSPSPHLTRIYDSGDFPAYDLALAIPRFVSPRSWNAADGRGEIRQVAELLVIRQTADVHFQVRLFLDRLDVHRGVNLPSPTNPWGAWGPTPAPPSRTLDEPRPR